MFNRMVEVKLVKKAKKGDGDPTDERELTAEDYLTMSRKIFDGGSMRIMKMVAGYVALDTARKIVVNRLSK
jgi:hypothetical protein